MAAMADTADASSTLFSLTDDTREMVDEVGRERERGVSITHRTNAFLSLSEPDKIRV